MTERQRQRQEDRETERDRETGRQRQAAEGSGESPDQEGLYVLGWEAGGGTGAGLLSAQLHRWKGT